MKNIFDQWKSLGKNFRRIYIPQHIIFITGLIILFIDSSSLWWLTIIYPSWFIIGHFGFGIIIHKYYCHNSFQTYPIIARLGAFIGMLSGTGSPIMTKAHHIGEHHEYVDSERDPHTPLKGKFYSYVSWVNNRWSFNNPRIVKDMLKDPYLKFYHRHYYKLYWGVWILFFLIDWRLAVFSLSSTAVLKFHQDGIINTWGHLPHKYSYQNYTEGKQVGNSQNIKWLNILTLGLGLHNNHHAQPWNYNYAHKPGEFDIAKWIVPIIEKK